MVVLCLPALFVGFVADDYYHRFILLDGVPATGFDDPLTDLFRFVPPGPGGDHLREVGVLPWWADPGLELGFFRPVTAATHLIDYSLWPNNPVLHHAQSLIWFGAVVLLVGIGYRQVNGTTAVAGLAVVLFAIEDAHSMNVGWLANRNASIALVFGLMTLLAHIRWRKDSKHRWLVGALVAFAFALLAGEMAVAVFAYIVAWQLTMDDARWPRRLAALIPYAVLILGWRVTSDALGYGCTGSDLYVDPVRQPTTFIGALIERWPVMAGGLWSQFNVDAWAVLGRPGQFALSVLGLAVCGFIVILLARLVRSSSVARFWALGAALALVPVSAAFPMNRLLLVSGIGVFSLLAMLADDVGLLGVDARDRRRWTCRSARVLLVLHGPVAVVLLIAGLLFLPAFNTFFTAGARLAPRDPAIADQSLIFINGHDFPCAYTSIIRRIDDAPAPLRVAILGPMTSAATVIREDDRTLAIVTDHGWFRKSIDRLMRSADSPLEVGTRVRAADFEATIRRLTADGRPQAVAFEFDQPLESGHYRFVHWQHGDLENWPLPEVGGTAEVAEESLFALK
jgi:hypothetical protein